MPQVFEITDEDVVSDLFRQQYAATRLRLEGRQPLWHLSQIRIGRARVDRSTFRVGVESSSAPLESIVVVRHRSGAVRYTCGASEEVYGPGDTSVPVPLGRNWASAHDGADCDLIVLDPHLLTEVAGDDTDSGSPVQLLSPRPRSAGCAAQLWRISEAISTSIDADPQAASYPLVTTSSAHLLTAAVLATFPSTVSHDPSIEDRHDAHPATVRRAIAFLESHPDQPIAAADIARACHVSLRAVQIAFRRHLDTTPMSYLRRIRLDRAHADLLAADPAEVTVASVAARWGFSGPSRFAADYRAAYGHSPHETLRGAQEGGRAGARP